MEAELRIRVCVQHGSSFQELRFLSRRHRTETQIHLVRTNERLMLAEGTQRTNDAPQLFDVLVVDLGESFFLPHY